MRTSSIDENDEHMWTDDDEHNDVTKMTGCVFCSRRLRFRNRTAQKLTRATTEAKKKQIFDILLHLNQHIKVNQLQNSKHIEYHLSCLAEYEHKIATAKENVKVETNRQKVHNAALVKVKQNVQETVIDKREVRSLNEIYQYYVALFDEQMPQTEVNSHEPVFKA